MDRVIYEDNEFNLQLMLKAKRVSYLHEICYKRRVRANSTVTSDKKFFHVYSCSKVVKKMQQLMSLSDEDRKLVIEILNGYYF